MKKKLLLINLPILCICTLWVGIAVSCNQPESDIVLDSQAISFEISSEEKSVIPIELSSGGRLEINVVCLQGKDIDLMVSNPSGQIELTSTGVDSEKFIIKAEESGVYVINLENNDPRFVRKGALFLKYIVEHNQKLLLRTTTKTVTQTRTRAQTTTLTQTITETKNPPITFSSRNMKLTTPFIINSSPWILQYSLERTSRLTISVHPEGEIEFLIVNEEEVIGGEVYQKVVEGYVGYPIHLAVRP
jgi:hypothetical protein